MALQDPWGYDGKQYSGQEMRLHTAAITGGRGGASTPTDLVATPQGSPNNTVSVAAGTGIIPATFAGDLGSYEVPNDAALTSPTFAATSANPRWDLLILQVTTGVAALVVVQGTASGSPSYPSLAGLTNYIVICGVKMPANKSIIDNGTNGLIEDRRSLWPAYVIATTLSQVPIPFDGQMVEETNFERVWIWDAGNSQWAPSRLLINSAAALPAAPKQGTPAYVSDAAFPTGALVPDATAHPASPGYYVFDQRWDPPWNLPWGIVDYNEVIADVTGLVAGVGICDSHSITYRAGRRLKITGQWYGWYANTTDNVLQFEIRESSSTFAGIVSRITDASISEGGGVVVAPNVKPTAAAHQYTLYCVKTTGSGTINIRATAVLPISILVEDMGPSGQPA